MQPYARYLQSAWVVLAVAIIVFRAHAAPATIVCAGPADGACDGGLPNGVCQIGEGCDDGATVNGDGCDNNCTTTACGNGITTIGEECDNGPDNDDINRNATPPGNPCDTHCRLKACGNHRIEGGEECDDGNAFNNDGCDSGSIGFKGSCLLTACGNGITNTNEPCDDGNTVNGGVAGDTCDQNCTPPGCGNGFTAGSEECDDGNTLNGDACDSGSPGTCTIPRCGNGVTAGSEQCDDGNTVNATAAGLDVCDGNCTKRACGNGIKSVDANGNPEQCDDGNTLSGDLCEPDCTIPPCGNGVTQFPEQCDDGNIQSGDGCNQDCRREARIICIDGSADPAMNVVEGYYLQHPQPGDSVHVGGDLADCAAQARPGFTVIIEAQGGPGTFTWGGVSYAGFGSAGGTGLKDLAPFPLTGTVPAQVKFQIESCFSAATPQGLSGAKSVVQSLQVSVGATATVSGTDAETKTGFAWSLSGGSVNNQAGAADCLHAAAVAASFATSDPVVDWLTSMRPGAAATAAANALKVASCPIAGGVVSAVLSYLRDDVGVMRFEFPCDHGCATSTEIRGPSKRAKRAAACNDALLKQGAPAALQAACLSLQTDALAERCAIPRVTELMALAYGPNDHSRAPVLGGAADPRAASEMRCQTAIGREVAAAFGKALKACARGKPTSGGTARFGRRITRACDGLLPFPGDATGTVPEVGLPCGPLITRSPISATSLISCLKTEVDAITAAVCPIRALP